MALFYKKMRKMKKSIKAFILFALATAMMYGVTYLVGRSEVVKPRHRMAMDPENVEKITGVDLPEISPGQLYDNLGRSSSRWDNFYRESYFVDFLTAEHQMKLDELCMADPLYWHKEDGVNLCYEYYDDAWGDGRGEYTIVCRIYEDRVSCEYLIDEDEGIGVLYVCLLIFLLMLLALAICGFVLIIHAVIKLILWIKNSKNGNKNIE